MATRTEEQKYVRKNDYSTLILRYLPDNTTMPQFIGLLESEGFHVVGASLDLVFAHPILLQASVTLPKGVADRARELLDGKTWQGATLEAVVSGDERR
jgi:hypothetical protein